LLPRQCKKWVGKQVLLKFSNVHSYAWTRELAMNLLNGKDDGYKGMLLREGQYCFIKCIGDINVHNRMLNVFGVYEGAL
jgi:hypothetical protein